MTNRISSGTIFCYLKLVHLYIVDIKTRFIFSFTHFLVLESDEKKSEKAVVDRKSNSVSFETK